MCDFGSRYVTLFNRLFLTCVTLPLYIEELLSLLKIDSNGRGEGKKNSIKKREQKRERNKKKKN
jgi:hypothetical protein